jgi:tryptophan 5-monooxygenase
MSASGKSLLGLWLYRTGGKEQEWAVKEGSPIHKPKDFIVNIHLHDCINSLNKWKIENLFSQKAKEEPTNDTQLSSSDRTSIIFTLKHQVGALARALQVFQELGINVLHIELHESGNESETVNFN